MKNVLFLFAALIVVFAYIRYVEYRALYFPMREIEVFPDMAGLAYEDCGFTSRDGKKLHGWFLPNKDVKFTLLFCHGNGGNVSHRIQKLLMLSQLGLEIFIFDYRGYGKSQGRPSEIGLYMDAQAAYDYLVSKRGAEPERIVLYGESLGGAVAINLAISKNIKAIILEDTFSSVRDMARVTFPYVPAFLVSAKYDSVSKIKNISSPKLIIHSINDDIIPYSLSEKLFEAASEPKTFLKLTGSHNTAFLDSEVTYRSGIKEFINKLR